jgi:hypothetical protein
LKDEWERSDGSRSFLSSFQADPFSESHMEIPGIPHAVSKK